MTRLPASVLAHLDLPVNRRLHGGAGTRPGRRGGPGSELLTTRPYVDGDDPRQVDWNASARTGALHVKSTVADIAVDVHLVLDASSSMRFGTTARKWDAAVSAAELLTLIANRGQEPVTIHVAGPTVDVTPLPSGRIGAGRVRHLADSLPAWEESGSLGQALVHLVNPRWRSGAVVVLTDMHLSDAELSSLGLAAMRHSVSVIEVVDPSELELVDIGVVTFADPETGTLVRADTGSRRLRQAFAEAATRRRADLADTLAAYGIAHLPVFTDEEVTVQLARQLPRR